MKSLIVVSFVVAFFICTWRVVNFLWLRPRKLEKRLRAQGLRGNPYKTLLGDFKQYVMMLDEAKTTPINLSDDIVPRVVPFYLETIKKYGKNCFIWLGPNPSVIIQDPVLLREIFMKNDIFGKPPPHPLGKIEALAVVNGDKWSKHRKIINPAFHLEKLKNMLPAFHSCASEMLRKWEEAVSLEGSCELDVWPYLETLTSDAISRTAFGSNYEKGRKIFELQKKQAELVTRAAKSLYFPGLRFFPTESIRKLKDIGKVVEATIRELIENRLEEIKAGETSRIDLLGILLESNLKEIEQQGNEKFGMSIKQVIEECRLFYFAGQETTSSLLVWTLILLSRNQDWQSRAREEVFQVFGRDEPHFDGLNHLKITWLAVNVLDYGVLGAALTLSLSWWLLVFFQGLYIILSPSCKETWTGFSRRAFRGIWPYFKLTVASAVMLCLEIWYFQGLVLISGFLSNPTIALDSISICMNYLNWDMQFMLGLAYAASVRVSNELGAGHAMVAKFSVVVVVTTSILISIVFAAIVLIFRIGLSKLFTSDSEVIEAVSSLTPLLAISVFMNGIQPILSGVAIGSGWQAVVAYVNLATYYIIGLPIGCVLGFKTSLGVSGIWWGMIIGVFLQTIALFIITVRTNWNAEVAKAADRLKNSANEDDHPISDSI